MKKPEPKKLPNLPWMPVTTYKVADAAAIQALQRGDASPEMQKRALFFIINVVCATYDEPFYNQDAQGQRNTDFALGRAFTGRQLVKLTKVDLSKLKQFEEEK